MSYKVAIVHDELIRRGGAEQVVLSFHKLFPQAPIYTMVYKPELTYSDFENADVRVSWYDKVVSREDWMKKLFFPFGYWAMKNLKVEGYDLVLLSTTYCAKYVKVSPKTIMITYCHCPFRLAWYPESYSEYNTSSGLKKYFFRKLISWLKKIDFKYAQRTNLFVANTKEMAEEIKRKYKVCNEVKVINPPVKCSKFNLSAESGGYYLVVSRLEYYKKIDLVVSVFNELELPLIIVGRGSREKELKQQAKSNITFRKDLTAEKIAELYSKAKALIFPQKEDYGITPLEASASGIPVIAYGRGGVLETMIPFNGGNAKESTAVFFEEQSSESLRNAIIKSRDINFDKEFIRSHAEKFDERRFLDTMKNLIENQILTIR